jgi:hypothetical protein
MNRLAKRLDPRLDAIDLFHDLTEAESTELALLDTERADLETTMTISGASGDYLKRLEAAFGIPTDPDKPTAARVSVVLSRLRGSGTTTPEMVRILARSFEYGDISIDETTTPYTVQIGFESIYGIPADMSDFKAALDMIKPAHIALEYVYKYNTWNNFEAFGYTWDQWDALGLTWDEASTYRG